MPASDVCLSLRLGACKSHSHSECPLVMGCQDSSFKVDGREELINAPLLLRVATNWVFCWKHRDVWQFLPSSYTAKKRPLAYGSATPATAVQAAA